MKNELCSCWSSILRILTRFPLIVDKKLSGLEERITIDGSEATLECIRNLTHLLLKFSWFFILFPLKKAFKEWIKNFYVFMRN